MLSIDVKLRPFAFQQFFLMVSATAESYHLSCLLQKSPKPRQEVSRHRRLVASPPTGKPL